jgi:hypothetical protein
MSKDPKKVAQETLEKITNELLLEIKSGKIATEEGVVTVSAESVNTKLKQHLENAYSDVSVEDKTALYRALAVKLHPDKIRGNYPEFTEHLDRLNIIDGPFKILNRLNGKNLLNDVKKDPVKGGVSLFEYILLSISPMKERLDRYYQPLKFLANSVYWTLIALIVVAAVAGVIGLVMSEIVVSIANSLINLALKLTVNDQYNKEVQNYLESNFDEHKKAYLKTVRVTTVTVIRLVSGQETEAERIENMSDEELYELIVTQKLQEALQTSFRGVDEATENELKKQIDELIKQDIIKSVDIGGFTKLRLTALSLYKSITKPFDEDNSNILLSLLLFRPLKVVISPFILGAVVTVELACYALTATVLAGVGVSALALTASLAVLNIPLFALDACRYAARKIYDCVCTKKETDELNKQTESAVLGVEWRPELSSSSSKDDEPPVHHGSLFGSPKSQRKASVVDEADEENTRSCGFC